MPQYELSIYKNFMGRGRQGSWCNTHEFDTAAAIDSTDLATIVAQVVDFEKALHTPSIQFIRAVCRLWDNEKDGYRPEEMRAIDASGAGSLAVQGSDNMLDLNLALDIKKFMTLGRQGHIYLRGCLTESMVNIDTAGNTTLVQAGIDLLQTALTGAVTLYADNAKTMVARSVLPNGDIVTRGVASLALGGVVPLKRNHRWFNRGNGNGGITPPDGP